MIKLPNPVELERRQFSTERPVVSLDTSNIFRGQMAFHSRQIDNNQARQKRVAGLIDTFTGGMSSAGGQMGAKQDQQNATNKKEYGGAVGEWNAYSYGVEAGINAGNAFGSY